MARDAAVVGDASDFVGDFHGLSFRRVAARALRRVGVVDERTGQVLVAGGDEDWGFCTT